jgi:tetratricopeptide (TPR) repeat protein
MTDLSRAMLRLDVARGHWQLGEREEALASLERLLGEELSAEIEAELDAAAADFGAEPRAAHLLAEVRTRLARATEADDEIALEVEDEDASEPFPVTPTMAELLESQGHPEKALRMAEDVLRRRPDDERALAIRDRLSGRPDPRRARDGGVAGLERWLDKIVQLRREREAHP